MDQKGGKLPDKLIDKLIVAARNINRVQEVHSKLSESQRAAEGMGYDAHISRFKSLLQELIAEQVSELLESKLNGLMKAKFFSCVDRLMETMEESVIEKILTIVDTDTIMKKIREVYHEGPVVDQPPDIDSVITTEPAPEKKKTKKGTRRR